MSGGGNMGLVTGHEVWGHGAISPPAPSFFLRPSS